MYQEKGAKQSDRLVLHRLAAGSGSSTFAHDVFTGLTADPKALPSKYFYDELGSHLFEALCCLPEYYVTRDEREILEKYSVEIIDAVNLPARHGVRLIELGSGSAEKTRQFIAPLLTRTAELHYVPIDISETSLIRSSEELLQLYPQLRITAYAGDFSPALDALTQPAAADQQTQRTIVMFLGSSIGNLTREESITLLRQVRGLLGPNDVMLLGADLKKSLDILLPAYNDALKVTAAFNLNLLVRINRELGGTFDIERFEHRALYNEELSRIEMHLFSRMAHSVRIQKIDLEVAFVAGESVHTENSYKFDLRMLENLAGITGFFLEKTWHDSNKRVSFSLFTAK
ncbi:MAG: L-histidine N(alpha)-methyltransferase [Acidobacteriota bacterium]